LEWKLEMKPYVLLLSVVIAASLATTAEAAKHARHHRAPAEASSTDWPGNPHMDITASQRDAFFRDAFNPAGAK